MSANVTERRGGRDAGRQGGREAGCREARRQGGREAGMQGGREAGRRAARRAAMLESKPAQQNTRVQHNATAGLAPKLAERNAITPTAKSPSTEPPAYAFAKT